MHEELPADSQRLVNFSMNTDTTPTPMAHSSAGTVPPLSDLVTKIGPNETFDHADFAALIGGIVSAVLLMMIFIIAVLMWCLSRHKGEYVTNEMDAEDEDIDSGDGESVGSDAALQSKEPLKAEEED